MLEEPTEFTKYDRAILLKNDGGSLKKTNICLDDLAYLLRLEEEGVKYELVRDDIGKTLAHVWLLEDEPSGEQEERQAKPLKKRSKRKRACS